MAIKKPKKKAAAARPAGFDIRSMLVALSNGSSQRSYRPTDIVFTQGDAADAVFYILKGNIRISVVSEQGKEGIITTLGPRNFFGEGCLAGQPLHMASAIAVGHAIVAKIVKE